jgi:hypothetical protein
MKKLLVIAIILLVGVLMGLTAPDEQKHKDVMMQAVKEFVDDEAEEKGFGDNAVTKLGKSVVVQAVKTALNAKLKFDNYYLFNTTHVKLKGENQMLSLGIFGQVITFDKDMLKEKLAEAAKTKEVEKVQKAAAKEEAKALKKRLKEERKRQKKLAKEEKRKAKQAAKEAKRKAKEAAKEAKRKAKEEENKK